MKASVDTAEDVALLLEAGCSTWDLQRVLGLKVDSIITACVRAKRIDVAEQVRAIASQDRKRAYECLV